MTGLGKRQMERFHLSLPAVITVKDKRSSGLNIQTELKTKNVCAGGTFLVSETPLEIGTDVDLNLQLAFFAGNIENERRSNIYISGTVIRIEPDGMAIKFDEKYQIVPVPKDAK